MRRRHRIDTDNLQQVTVDAAVAKPLHPTETDISGNNGRRLTASLESNNDRGETKGPPPATDATALPSSSASSAAWPYTLFKSEHPTTAALMLLLTFVYIYHCRARRKRRNLVVTYHAVVQKKQYYRTIGALLAHPPTLNRTSLIRSVDSRPSNSASGVSSSFIHSPTHQSSPPSAAIGGNNATANNRLSLSSLVDRLQDGTIGLLTRMYNAYQRSSLTNGRRLSGLPLLLYNFHLLWTCRSLEVAYSHNQYIPRHRQSHKNKFSLLIDDDLQQTMEEINNMEEESAITKIMHMRSAGDGWHYARLVFGLTVIGVILDLILSYYLLTLLRHANHAVSSPIQDGNGDNNDGSALTSPISIGEPSHSYRQGRRNSSSDSSNALIPREQLVTRRPMGSITLTTSSLIWVFQDVFPDATIPVLPNMFFFLPGSLSGMDDYDGPNRFHVYVWSLFPPYIPYLMCLLLLARLSWTTHPVTSILCGSGAGFLYTHGVLSFLIDEPYWNFGLLLAVIVMCTISCKVHNAGGVASRLLPCIESVACNRKGHILALDANGRRIEDEVYGNEGGYFGDDDDDSSSTSSATSSSEDNLDNDPDGISDNNGIRASDDDDDDDDDVEALARHFFRGRRHRRGLTGRRRRHLGGHSEENQPLMDRLWGGSSNRLDHETIADNMERNNEMDHFPFADALNQEIDDHIELANTQHDEEHGQSSLLSYLPEQSPIISGNSAAIRSRRTATGTQASASDVAG